MSRDPLSTGANAGEKGLARKTTAQQDIKNIFAQVPDFRGALNLDVEQKLQTSIGAFSQRGDLNTEERVFVDVMKGVMDHGTSSDINGSNNLNHGSVSEYRQEAVFDAINQFGYLQNPLDEQSRQKNTTQALGKVISQSSHVSALTTRYSSGDPGILDNISTSYAEHLNSPPKAQTQTASQQASQLPEASRAAALDFINRANDKLTEAIYNADSHAADLSASTTTQLASSGTLATAMAQSGIKKENVNSPQQAGQGSAQEDIENIFKQLESDKGLTKEEMGEALKKLAERTDLNPEERAFLQVMESVMEKGLAPTHDSWVAGHAESHESREMRAVADAVKEFKYLVTEKDPQKRQDKTIQAISNVAMQNKGVESLTNAQGNGVLDNCKDSYKRSLSNPVQAQTAQAAQQVDALALPAQSKPQVQPAQPKTFAQEIGGGGGFLIMLIKFVLNAVTLGAFAKQLESDRSKSYEVKNDDAPDLTSVLLQQAAPAPSAPKPRTDNMNAAVGEAMAALGRSASHVAPPQQEVAKEQQVEVDPLAKAILSGDDKQVASYLEAHQDVDVNAVGKDGKTALDHVTDMMEKIAAKPENKDVAPKDNAEFQNACNMLDALVERAVEVQKTSLKTGGEVQEEKAKAAAKDGVALESDAKGKEVKKPTEQSHADRVQEAADLTVEDDGKGKGASR